MIKMFYARWNLVLLLAIWLTSCSLAGRGMLDNHTYYSSYGPNIRIDVDERFTYDRDTDSQYRYIFINEDAHRTVVIEFMPLRLNERNVDYWHNPITWIFYDIKNSEEIAKGKMTIMGQRWYYRDLAYHYSTAECYLLRDIGHFSDKHDVLKILYAQELPPYRCKSWKDLSALDEAQQTRFERFLNSMAQDVQMSPYVPDEMD